MLQAFLLNHISKKITLTCKNFSPIGFTYNTGNKGFAHNTKPFFILNKSQRMIIYSLDTIPTYVTLFFLKLCKFKSNVHI